ncbi:hypothetical protein [Methylosinus sp. LW4]|uniref:hypothetical protein n=1 Tax=Methylosinus sp. LW4 TaxID=136993 RepID=UPI00035E09E5|nr:hypothetical protein [Methylosinus sp. LW4]
MNIDNVRAHFAQSYPETHLEILHDSGLYRHIRIRGAHYYRFELVTWPGSLLINCEGDIYCFSRTADMFGFFRVDGERGEPNFSYWAEKLSDPRSKSVRGFAYDKFARDIEERLAELADQSRAEELRRELADECYEDDEETCRSFAHGHKELRGLAMEREWKDWTHRYAYACFAILLGIAEYNRAKEKAPVAEPAQ